jgi:hypothetical protein
VTLETSSEAVIEAVQRIFSDLKSHLAPTGSDLERQETEAAENDTEPFEFNEPMVFDMVCMQPMLRVTRLGEFSPNG